MRTATATEYAHATARAGQKRQMHTKRTSDVFWSDRGTEVASKHEILTRGKVTSVSYRVNPAYLGAPPCGTCGMCAEETQGRRVCPDCP